MAYALVGTAGTLASGTTSVTPSFAQATSAGNLLICVAASSFAADHYTITGTGWVDSQAGNGFSDPAAIFYKPNCSAGESAPTITGSSGATVFAALLEFSGGATTSPLDQKKRSTSASSPLVSANPAADAAAGELFVSAGQWTLSKAATVTTTDTYNNGATPTTNYNNDSTSAAGHYRMAWGITTGNAAADQDSQTNSSMNISGGIVVVASFKLAAAAAATSLIYADRRVARNSLVRR